MLAEVGLAILLALFSLAYWSVISEISEMNNIGSLEKTRYTIKDWLQLSVRGYLFQSISTPHG